MSVDLARAARGVAVVTARFVDEFASQMFTEIRDGGRYSPGTPVKTGRTRDAWEREDAPALVRIRNQLPHIKVLEHGWSDQAPMGFVRIAVASASLIAADAGRRAIQESASNE